MAKIKIIALACLLCMVTASCTKILEYTNTIVTPDFEPAVVKTVSDHTLAIATVYAMSEAEWSKRMRERAIKVPMRPWEIQEIAAIPLTVKDAQGNVVKFLAYIGSATVIKENHAISVSHLFSHEEGTLGFTIWAFKEGIDHGIKCDLIARGDIDADFVNDYAIIKLQEDLMLPGLKISRIQPTSGERVIFTGSVGGLAYFTRFGYITDLEWYFKVGEDGQLHLSQLGTLKFMVLYPGGPGDSGGSVKNMSGEIVGIMYCGIDIYSENYIMINPTEVLWNFLKAAGLERLGGQDELPKN